MKQLKMDMPSKMDMLKRMTCSIDNNLLNAWRVINENGKGIVFVIGRDKKLAGILTDGDIRSYLLRENNFNKDLDSIMNKDFVYARFGMDPKAILNLFNEKIKIIPVVNDAFELVDYVEYNTNIYIPVAMPDLQGNEFKYLTDAFLSTWISSKGNYITLFENNFSRYCDSRYGVAVSNGTVALHLALLALGIGKGDEVIVPDLTFAATINAVLHANATPVIVDVEPESWCIDPAEIRKAITPKTKAIIPVHLYGQAADMRAIMEIALEYKLYVIEDCAEAHGAEFENRKVGSFGDIGCFSFFGNKIITTGEGGMCITNNSELDERLRILRDHGMSKTKRYWHDEVGYNYRMTNLQAAIGVAQLERIDEILEQREKLEMRYRRILRDSSHIYFQKNDFKDRKKITWFVSIVIDGNRDEYLNVLSENGIDTRPFFYPLSIMPPYKEYVFSNQKSCEISRRGVNLPTNNYLTDETILRIKQILDNSK